MILTPIPSDQLAATLDRFGTELRDPLSRHVFRQIRATSPDRAIEPEAERHRQQDWRSPTVAAWRYIRRDPGAGSTGMGQR